MLKLPDVTLVMIETLEYELASLAIRDCLNKAEFGDVLIFTDQPEKFQIRGPRYVKVENWPNKLGWSQCSWYDVPLCLKTSQALYIQWDSWIWDVEKWDPRFLDYDIIGAPWWYTDGKNVGNLGFSFRSTAILKYLLRWRDKIPCAVHSDDDLLCRKYRRSIELDGFRWAPESLAREFAFECTRPSLTSRHFGFHGAFNFNEVLDHDALLERARLIAKSPYIKRTGHIWNSVMAKYPEVMQEVA